MNIAIKQNNSEYLTKFRSQPEDMRLKSYGPGWEEIRSRITESTIPIIA
jgi:hypothetical protein